MKRKGTNKYNKRKENHRNNKDTKHNERTNCTERKETRPVNVHTIKANETTQKQTNIKKRKDKKQE